MDVVDIIHVVKLPMSLKHRMSSILFCMCRVEMVVANSADCTAEAEFFSVLLVNVTSPLSL